MSEIGNLRVSNAVLRERLRAIIDWADFAAANPKEFSAHGIRNLDGPIFDAARAILAEGNENTEVSSEDIKKELSDLRDKLEAYHSMLGPNGLKVAAMWQALQRLVLDDAWTPEGWAMTGEERAAFILERATAPTEPTP